MSKLREQIAIWIIWDSLGDSLPAGKMPPVACRLTNVDDEAMDRDFD